MAFNFFPNVRFAFKEKPPSTKLSQVAENTDYLLELIPTKRYAASDFISQRTLYQDDAEVYAPHQTTQTKKSCSISVTGGEPRLKISFELQGSGDASVKFNGTTKYTTSNSSGYNSYTVTLDATAYRGTTLNITLVLTSTNGALFVKNFRVYAPQTILII